MKAIAKVSTVQDENSAVILVSSRSLNSRMPPRSLHVKEKNIKCINVRASLMIYPMKGTSRFAGYGSLLPPPDTLRYNIERNPWGEWEGWLKAGRALFNAKNPRHLIAENRIPLLQREKRDV